jgi:hypothetical protein
MPITEHRTLVDDALREAWKLYAEVFAEIDAFAAQRHLMTEDEFVSVATNNKVRKYLVRDTAGQLVGMSTLTNVLSVETTPLISARYFARRYPKHFERGAVWYCGFVGARGRNEAHAFSTMVQTMWERIRSNDGVVGLDYCMFNVTHRNIPKAAEALLRHAGYPVRTQQLDAQTYWTLEPSA